MGGKNDICGRGNERGRVGARSSNRVRKCKREYSRGNKSENKNRIGPLTGGGVYRKGGGIEEGFIKASKKKEGKNSKKEYKLVWVRDKEEEYREKMRETEVEIEKGKGSLGYQERWERLTKYIWEVGKELKMIREINKGDEREEKDEDIKAQKKNTWEALKKWARTRKEEDREELKEERKRLKEVRKEKKEEEREKRRKRVENSRNMGEFWDAIRGFRPRKMSKGENIGKREWLDHFKGLLGGEAKSERGREEEGREGEREEEGEGVEELDREITQEEVERTIGEMKNGKAHGEDGIKLEFFKYLPRL